MARIGGVALVMAGLVLAGAARTPAAETTATDKRLADALAGIRSKQASVRAPAARALGNLDDPRALAPLVAAVHDADVGVRLAAVQGLAGHLTQESAGSDTRAVDALAGALKDDVPEVRAAAADSLDSPNPIARNAVAALVAAVDDADHAVRRAAVGTLGSLGDAAAFDALVGALVQTDDASLRVGAAAALGDLKDPRAAPALLEALQATDDALRAASARALGRGRFGDTVLAPLHTAACGDKEPRVREVAVAALGDVGSAAALDALKCGPTKP